MACSILNCIHFVDYTGEIDKDVCTLERKTSSLPNLVLPDWRKTGRVSPGFAETQGGKTRESQMSSSIQKAIAKQQLGRIAKNLGVGGTKSHGSKDSKGTLGLDDSTAGIFEDCEESAAFSNAPRNYPPLVNLVYIDLAILSPEARHVAATSHVVYLVSVAASFLNIGIHAFRSLSGVAATNDLVLSAVSLILFSAVALSLYNLAFRACMKSSRQYQRIYVFLSMLYLLVTCLPAFTKLWHFHGWLRLNAVDPELNPRVERMMFAVESVTWNLVLFLQTHASFEMWSFRASHVPGLSKNAPSPVTSKNSKNESNSVRSSNPKQAKIDDIKARYASS